MQTKYALHLSISVNLSPIPITPMKARAWWTSPTGYVVVSQTFLAIAAALAGERGGGGVAWLFAQTGHQLGGHPGMVDFVQWLTLLDL